MISINGRVFSGSNVTIVNGRVISGGGTGKAQKFDERKAEDCNNIEKIAIDSMFPFPIRPRLKHISMVRQILTEMSTLMFE